MFACIRSNCAMGYRSWSLDCGSVIYSGWFTSYPEDHNYYIGSEVFC